MADATVSKGIELHFNNGDVKIVWYYGPLDRDDDLRYLETAVSNRTTVTLGLQDLGYVYVNTNNLLWWQAIK